MYGRGEYRLPSQQDEHLRPITDFLHAYNDAVAADQHPPATDRLSSSEAGRVERFLRLADPLGKDYRVPLVGLVASSAALPEGGVQ